MTPLRQWPVRHQWWTGPLKAMWGKPVPVADTLSLHDTGAWQLASRGAGRPLHLLHVWHAFAWMTLKLSENAVPAGRPLQLTVWKFGLPPQAWRDLCVCVARQTAMPQRGGSKKDNP